MIKNFLFILNRFKTSSTLNIIGLSVAFPVFAITMIQTYYDFSYNRNFKHADEIYLFANYWKEMDNTMPSISIPLAHKMTGQFPEIQAACILNRGNQREFQLPDIPESSFTLSLIKADEGLLTVFSPKILMGDAEKAFTERNNVMLTSDVARTLFGKENPVGKILGKIR
jgi:putative ABC transport system permease protein